MLRDNLHKSSKMVIHGFLVSIESEVSTDVTLLTTKLSDACRWIEGVGETDVEYVGELEEEEVQYDS